MSLFSAHGSFVFLFADDTLAALLFHLPPRIPRYESVMRGQTPVTLPSHIQRDKGTKAKGFKFEPADAA